MSVYDIPSECNEDTGHHIVADICKCKYDKKEQNRKQINLIATIPDSWVGDPEYSSWLEKKLEKIKELSK